MRASPYRTSLTLLTVFAASCTTSPSSVVPLTPSARLGTAQAVLRAHLKENPQWHHIDVASAFEDDKGVRFPLLVDGIAVASPEATVTVADDGRQVISIPRSAALPVMRAEKVSDLRGVVFVPFNGELRLVRVVTEGSRVEWRDPTTDEVLVSQSTLLPVTGIARTSNFGDASVETTAVAGGYQLVDETRDYLETFSGCNEKGDAGVFSYVDADNTWGTGVPLARETAPTPANNCLKGNGQTAAVEAQLLMALAHDFFMAQIGESTTRGGGLKAIVHYQNTKIGPYYNPGTNSVHIQSTFGNCSELTNADITGHEIVHAFYEAHVNPLGGTYVGESGGINEANSDILGEVFELAIKRRRFCSGNQRQCAQRPSWNSSQCGQILRYFDRPSKNRQSLDAWSPDINGSSMDSHRASGPIDRFFYFLSEGVDARQLGVDTDRTSRFLPEGMSGLGIDKATSVWVSGVARCLGRQNHEPVLVNFLDLRNALLRCAVKDSVGVRQAIEDAFAAVNIGAPTDRVPPQLTLRLSDQEDTFELSGNATDNVHVNLVELTIDGVSWSKLRPSTPGYIFVIPKLSLLNGQRVARVRVLDDIGNETALSVTLAVDNPAPRIIAVVAQGPKKTPTLSVKAQAASVSVLKNGIALASSNGGDPGFRLPIDTSTWSDGTHTLEIVATNLQGVAAQPYVQLADNTKPTVAFQAITSTVPPFKMSVTAVDAAAQLDVRFFLDASLKAHRRCVAHTRLVVLTDRQCHAYRQSRSQG